MGDLNVLAVRAVHPQGKGSRVELEGGNVVECALSVASLRNRLLRAQLVLRELERGGMLSRQGNPSWRQMLDLIRAVLAQE